MKKPVELKVLADLVQGEVQGNPRYPIRALNAVDKAGPEEISFLVPGKKVSNLRAGALLVAHDSPLEYPNLVRVDSPAIAFARLLEFFYPGEPFWQGISDQAVISPEARLGREVSVGPFSSVGKDTEIGDGTEIHAGVIIYRRVRIGKGCTLYSNVVIREEVEIGDHVVIHAGAVIGADGFGFQRKKNGKFVKVPQKGRVVIEDHCEIGANVCIDRSTIEETRIGADVKLDNLVQIGHNVRVGNSTAISALTGVAGSARIGRQVTIGGQVGIADHVSIADGTMIAGKTGVTGQVKSKAIIAGYPHKDIRNWRREQVILRNIEAHIQKIRELEDRIAKLEGKQ